MEFVESKRGGEMLAFKGFMYHKRYERNGYIYWSCVYRKECSGNAMTRENSNRVICKVQHTHPPNKEKIEACKLLNDMKRKATDHFEMGPTQILRDTLTVASDNVLIQLPQISTIKRSLNRKRQNNLPKNRKSLSDIKDIPEDCKLSLDGEVFLLFDNCRDDKTKDKIIIYATKSNLMKLGQSKTWFLDVTFQVGPNMPTQIFIIQGLYQGQVFPFVYALISNKNEKTYTIVLDQIKIKCNNFNINLPDPDIFVSGFELDIINAQQHIFPKSTRRLCLYYFEQNINNSVPGQGSQGEYINSETPEIKLGIQQLISLAFVPPTDVEYCFDLLLEELPECLIDLAEYIEKTYIRGIAARGKRKAIPPKYPVCLWNQYEAGKNGDLETNNLMGGRQSRFQNMIGKYHLNVYHLIRCLIKEQQDMKNMIIKVQARKQLDDSPNIKQCGMFENLQGVILHYEELKKNNRVLDYLRICSEVYFV